MPALVYRRRTRLAQRRKPRRFVWTVVGPVTYDKTGSLTSGAVLAGTDVFEAAESGSLTPFALMSGTSQAILQRSLLLRTWQPLIIRRRRR